MSERHFALIVVMYLQRVGGRIAVLCSVERDGRDLCSGEPVLIIEMRPGGGDDDASIELSELLVAGNERWILAAALTQLGQLLEAAHDEEGMFSGRALVGQRVEFAGPEDLLELAER